MQPVVDGTALVVFVLAVAILSEYVFLNGYPYHRLVAFAGAVPLVPLLPRYVDWLASQPLALTWVTAGATGFLTVSICQRALVVRLDRALEERRHRRKLLDLRESPRLATPVEAEPDAPAADPEYFRSADFDAVFGPVATGDPLAQSTHRRHRDVA
jgi:hypothetical protein